MSHSPTPQPVRMKVLVTGARGYVGSRLVPRLLADGHDVRVTATSEPDPEKLWWLDRVDVARMDVLELGDVEKATEGIEAVYYLIHDLGEDDFATTDRVAAQNTVSACQTNGVERVVYLSGLVPDVPDDEQSEHIASRLEVERILTTAAGITTITLRAAVLLGAASTSYEIVRQISNRLPIQTMPTWMKDCRVQPIAFVDALEALVGALTVQTRSRYYDIGSTEVLSYGDLVATYGEVAGLTRGQVPVPFLPTRLVGVLAGLLTDVPVHTVESLVESLHHDMVCGGRDFEADLLPEGHQLVRVREAIERALRRNPEDVPPEERDVMGNLPQDPAWVTSRF